MNRQQRRHPDPPPAGQPAPAPNVVTPGPIPMTYLVTAVPAAGTGGIVLEIFSAAGQFVTFLDAAGAKHLAAELESKATEAQSGLTVVRRDPRGPSIKGR